MRKIPPLDPVSPYKTQDSKKAQVTRMFDRIAGRYDFLNSLLSLGIDHYWRKKTLQRLQLDPHSSGHILDVATGTCVLAIQAAKTFPSIRVTALDISQKMLDFGRRNIEAEGIGNRIQTQVGDAERLAFAEGSFDAVMVAFGVRNFENLEAGLREMARVLKPGGRMVVLEFSKPRKFPVKQLFHFYFRYILPVIGRVLSRDPRAYSYLFESVQHFPDYERFRGILEQTGLRECGFTPLTFGICSMYYGYK